MAKHSMPEMKEGGVNVTPLIDIVMCLIIFYMLVAKIGIDTGAKKMELPETIIGVKIEALGPNMLLNVTDPNIELDPGSGKVIKVDTSGLTEPVITAMVDPGSKEAKQIGLPELTAILIKAHAANPLFSVTIRAQKDLKFDMLKQVLAAAGKAEISKVNFASSGKTLGGKK